MTIEDLKRWADVRPGYWFAPKVFGWGATPVRWQGWAMLGGFLALALATALVAQRHGMVWLFLLGPLLGAMLVVTVRRTDGAWRWRWGDLTR